MRLTEEKPWENRIVTITKYNDVIVRYPVHLG